MQQNKVLEVDCWSNAPKTLKGCESRLQQYSLNNDTGILIQHGSKNSLLELESKLNDLSNNVSKKQDTNYEKPRFIQIADTIRKDGSRVLRRLFMENFVIRELDAGTSRHKVLLFAASAYIFGMPPPKLSNKMKGDSIVAEETRQRQTQQAVGSDVFHA